MLSMCEGAAIKLWWLGKTEKRTSSGESQWRVNWLVIMSTSQNNTLSINEKFAPPTTDLLQTLPDSHETMSPQNDDKPPDSYKYAWATGSDISLKDFLAKVCPTQLVLNSLWSLLLWSERASVYRSSCLHRLKFRADTVNHFSSSHQWFRMMDQNP